MFRRCGANERRLAVVEEREGRNVEDGDDESVRWRVKDFYVDDVG